MIRLVYDHLMNIKPNLVDAFIRACLQDELSCEQATEMGDRGGGAGVGFGDPKTIQAQKFSWVTGEDQAPAVETKRLEDVHGVRVRTALHTLSAMGPDDPRKNKSMKIMEGGRFAPIYPTVREIATDLNLI